MAAPLPDSSAARAELAAVLVGAGEGDRSAFLRVYRLTRGKLFGICLRISGDRQSAEDILQDVYATVWKRAGSYDPARAGPMAWLGTIARNRAIDWRRGQGRRRAVPIDETTPIADGRLDAAALMTLAEEERRLHLCLDALADAERAAIRTAFFDGVTYRELAEREAVPLATMKSRIRRGLRRLKDCLDDGD